MRAAGWQTSGLAISQGAWRSGGKAGPRRMHTTNATVDGLVSSLHKGLDAGVRKLWCAVLVQAVLDAAISDARLARLRASADAHHRWLGNDLAATRAEAVAWLESEWGAALAELYGTSSAALLAWAAEHPDARDVRVSHAGNEPHRRMQVARPRSVAAQVRHVT